MENSSLQKVESILSQYSAGDIARSLFALDVWLPNVSSPIKVEYLYVALERCANSLQEHDKIASYRDFRALCEALFSALPSFPMLEDYLPEDDWGGVKYFFQGRIYKVLYGGNLENPYDRLSAFEILHCGLDKEYRKLIGQSPVDDLRFFLEVQDDLLQRLDQPAAPRELEEVGHLEIPPEDFWVQANRYLTAFSSNASLDAALLERFAHRCGSGTQHGNLTEREFADRVMDGRNCPYFFLKIGERYYPVMPRRYLSILYDRWGGLMRTNIASLTDTTHRLDGSIEINLASYILARLDNKAVFSLVSAVTPDGQPHPLTFAAAITSGERVYFVHLVSVTRSITDPQGYLATLGSSLTEALTHLSATRLQFIVWSTGERAEFAGERRLKPVMLVVMPHVSTVFQTLEIPQDIPAEVLPLDQFLGVVDELRDPGELSRFLDYRHEHLSSGALTPFTSVLDLYGSFRDSHAVLVAGAIKPDRLFLDLNWGTNYRFRSLTDFWSTFPSMSYIGHPRSWARPADAPPNALQSRQFRGYAYFAQLGSAVFFATCPVEELDLNEGKNADLAMQCLCDAVATYAGIARTLALASAPNRIHVFFVPTTATQRSPRLTHLRAQVPRGQVWTVLTIKTEPHDVRLAVVFDTEAFTATFLDAIDRSAQIDLLVDILTHLEKYFPTPHFADVCNGLVEEREQPNRYRLYTHTKDVSIPEHVPLVLPGSTEYKLADRTIAELAKVVQVEPKVYSGDTAKTAIKALLKAAVGKLDSRVEKFSFTTAIPTLLAGVEAVVHNYEVTRVRIEASRSQEVGTTVKGP